MSKLVCTEISTDRDSNPLMKDLHELGLKHGVKMVVVTLEEIEGKDRLTGALCIDHKDDTRGMDVAMMYGAAAYYLMDAAQAVAVYAHKNGEKLPDPDDL